MLLRNIRLGVVLACFSFCGLSFGASKLITLAEDPAWLSLLHYEPRWFGKKLRSVITEDGFFLADDGNVSALNELHATVQAFIDDGPEGQMRCRFPARFSWLKIRVEKLSSIKTVSCSEFEEWLGNIDIDSVSMVFAAGHMKSPASYFGHNFLKFNSSTEGNFLLDHTVNYGAEVPPEHGAVPYLYNGIFGGYEATYETQQFFRHMALYGEEDLRDLWEYVLDLDGAEIDLLLRHTWELQNQKLSYYFFRENCAYHIARLLGLVSTESLVPKYMPWTMPYNVMSRLVEVERNDKPFIKDIIYHPSRRSRFQRGFASLSPLQKKQVVGVVNSDFPESSLQFELEADGVVEVIDTLFDYYELMLRLDDSNQLAKDAKQKLLLKRLSYPPSADSRNFTENLYAPHLAQKPGYANLSFSSNRAAGNEVEIGLRPAYFDFLSHDIGRSNNGNFTLLDTRLRVKEDQLRLYSLNLMDITNLVPATPGVGGDLSMSWRFRFGFDQTNNGCSDCIRPMLDWQIGRAWQSHKMTFFAMTGMRLQKEFERDNTLVLQTTLGATGHLGSRARVYATIGRHEDMGSAGLDRNPVSVQLRLGERRGWDVRLQYTRDITEEFKLTLGGYW